MSSQGHYSVKMRSHKDRHTETHKHPCTCIDFHSIFVTAFMPNRDIFPNLNIYLSIPNPNLNSVYTLIVNQTPIQNQPLNPWGPDFCPNKEQWVLGRLRVPGKIVRIR